MRLNNTLVEEEKEMNLEDQMLTTIDNPFNPKKDYEKWKQFDLENNYNTEEYLARIADIPGDIELDNEPLINRLTTQAMYEILEHDVLGIYKLV